MLPKLPVSRFLLELWFLHNWLVIRWIRWSVAVFGTRPRAARVKGAEDADRRILP